MHRPIYVYIHVYACRPTSMRRCCARMYVGIYTSIAYTIHLSGLWRSSCQPDSNVRVPFHCLPNGWNAQPVTQRARVRTSTQAVIVYILSFQASSMFCRTVMYISEFWKEGNIKYKYSFISQTDRQKQKCENRKTI